MGELALAAAFLAVRVRGNAAIAASALFAGGLLRARCGRGVARRNAARELRLMMAMKRALAAACLLLGCGCAHERLVERVYDGHLIEGRSIEPAAYAAFLRGAIAEASGLAWDGQHGEAASGRASSGATISLTRRDLNANRFHLQAGGRKITDRINQPGQSSNLC